MLVDMRSGQHRKLSREPTGNVKLSGRHAADVWRAGTEKMADTQIDRYPVKELPGRYSINRSVLYSRLKALNIKPHASGKQSYVTGQDLNLLDRLHQHLQQGGITSEFLAQQKTTRQQQDKTRDIYQTNQAKLCNQKGLTPLNSQTIHLPDHTRQDGLTGQLALSADTWKLLAQEIAIETATKIGQQQSSSDPLADLELLQRVADHGWLIPTSRLAAIVGLSPGTLSGRKEFSYCGFTISKAGKQGNETAWKVSQG